MTIGKRIKERRIELGLTVDQVAEALNKNRATIYRYESNDIEKLPIDILEPLATVLSTTPAYLMGWENKKTVHSNNSERDKEVLEIMKIYLSLSDEGKTKAEEYAKMLKDTEVYRASHDDKNKN